MPKKRTIPDLKKTLDTIFSKYIRMRDALITTSTLTDARCYTCGKRLPTKRMDAGHWRSRSNGATRYDERNVKAQCKGCNGFHNGMQEEFRRHLVEEYGVGVVDEIYFASKQPHNFKKSWLEERIKYYKEEVKFLEEQDYDY